MDNIIGLKELRTNTAKYIKEINKGKSFIILKKSKPVFKITPPQTNDIWEEVADFTTINKNGVSAKDVLKALRQLNA